jgi:hypothetical protein
MQIWTSSFQWNKLLVTHLCHYVSTQRKKLLIYSVKNSLLKNIHFSINPSLTLNSLKNEHEGCGLFRRERVCVRESVSVWVCVCVCLCVHLTKPNQRCFCGKQTNVAFNFQKTFVSLSPSLSFFLISLLKYSNHTVAKLKI